MSRVKKDKPSFQFRETSNPATTSQGNVTMSETKAGNESTSISTEDLTQLQLKYKDFQLATLQHKLAIQELEKAVESSRAELVKVNDAVNQKYRLDPAKDKINLQDGTITRG